MKRSVVLFMVLIFTVPAVVSAQNSDGKPETPAGTAGIPAKTGKNNKNIKQIKEKPAELSGAAKTVDVKTNKTPSAVRTGVVKPEKSAVNPLLRPKGKEIVLTLEKAEKTALENNIELRIKTLSIREAEINKNIVKHQMYPLVKVEANALLWNDKLELSFDLPDGLLQMLNTVAPGMAADMPPMLVRKQFTMQGSITVIQPLTPLLSLKSLYKLKESEVQARRVKLNMSKTDILKKVEEAYINCLRAESYIRLMEEAEKMLLNQKERVRFLMEAKYATIADMSRVESELAKIKAKKIKTLAASSLAKQYLAYLIGYEPDANIKITVPSNLKPSVPDTKQCFNVALKKRREFKLIDYGNKQILHAKKALKWDKIPQIAAVAQYQRSEGFGSFQPANQAFVGISLKWEFQWKNKWRKADKLTLKQRELELQLEQAKRGIKLEIHKNMLSFKSSLAMIEAAKATLDSFRKTYRKTVTLYKNQAATNTDVLEAATNLTKAEVDLTNERYNAFLKALQYLKSCGY